MQFECWTGACTQRGLSGVDGRVRNKQNVRRNTEHSQVQWRLCNVLQVLALAKAPVMLAEQPINLQDAAVLPAEAILA